MDVDDDYDEVPYFEVLARREEERKWHSYVGQARYGLWRNAGQVDAATQ